MSTDTIQLEEQKNWGSGVSNGDQTGLAAMMITVQIQLREETFSPIRFFFGEKF